jgi:hypothetical protein
MRVVPSSVTRRNRTEGLGQHCKCRSDTRDGVKSLLAPRVKRRVLCRRSSGYIATRKPARAGRRTCYWARPRWLGGRSPAPRVRWRWESLILAPSVAEAGAGAKRGERIGLSKRRGEEI